LFIDVTTSENSSEKFENQNRLKDLVINCMRDQDTNLRLVHR